MEAEQEAVRVVLATEDVYWLVFAQGVVVVVQLPATSAVAGQSMPWSYACRELLRVYHQRPATAGLSSMLHVCIYNCQRCWPDDVVGKGVRPCCVGPGICGACLLDLIAPVCE